MYTSISCLFYKAVVEYVNNIVLNGLYEYHSETND